MKKYDEYINESVFKVNLHYTKLQNKTKELFFKCLEEDRSDEYFAKQLEKIWGNIDHDFMYEALEEYRQMIRGNKSLLVEEYNKQRNNVLEIISAVVLIGYEIKLMKQKEKEYKRAKKSYLYKGNRLKYLSNMVKGYTTGVVPYHNKKNGTIRQVPLSVYASMVQNTNLVRTGWDEILNNADLTGHDLFYIPFHIFSCPHCIQYQNIVYDRKTVEDVLLRKAQEQEGDILHPNCKCQLVEYYPGITEFNRPPYTDKELEEQYKIRQKVNSLTLEKSRLRTDMKIQKQLGEQEEYDKLNQKRNKINAKIRELKNELPTEELKTSVVAINRK